MRKTDISKFTGKQDIQDVHETPVTKSKVRIVFSVIWKFVLTIIMVFVSAGIIIGISMVFYVTGLANEPTGIDLHARALNLSSHIYCQNPETEKFEETQVLYGLENRVWVNLDQIPKAMRDAIVAIEDKRFYNHQGVDWVRTSSAVFSLVTGTDSYGGSTLTQQLIKNLTSDNEVSLTRKLREIFRALNVEHEYTKDEIIEAYLNVVNFGNNCQGVEASAKLYFGKSISECSVAECAAIAGITQNPSKWNPLIYPENNKLRRETILEAMHEQKDKDGNPMLTDKEYQQALKDSENMTFVGYTYDEEDDESTSNVQSWYIDNMFVQLQEDLAKEYNISLSKASDKLFTEGYKIYCAVDLNAQKIMEDAALNLDTPYDDDLQIGMSMVDFKGRILATVGSRKEKDGNLLFSRATDSKFQPGSSIKPLFAYPLAIDKKEINFSSTVKDEYIEDYYGTNKDGPFNWYKYTHGNMLVTNAIEWSANCPPARLIESLGTKTAYDQAVTLMGFSHLDSKEDPYSVGSLSIGGSTGGTNPQEMAAAFCYMGNGGRYYKPYSYYYVTDSNDKEVILDNRDSIPKQAYSPETAAIMNRLLRYNIVNSSHTNAYLAKISGWDIIGKTGTTDEELDSWFCGLSPYGSLAVWTGFDLPDTISKTGQKTATETFNKVMSKYLENKKDKDYVFPETVLERQYCNSSGLLASSYCTDTFTGYYTEDNMPGYCYGSHGGSGSGGGDGDDDDPTPTDNVSSSSSVIDTPNTQGEEDTTIPPTEKDPEPEPTTAAATANAE